MECRTNATIIDNVLDAITKETTELGCVLESNNPQYIVSKAKDYHQAIKDALSLVND